MICCLDKSLQSVFFLHGSREHLCSECWIFFEGKGHYCLVIKCDLRDRTGVKSEDRHHKVCVSMLGRFTQLNTSGSSTVQLVFNCCLPYNASVPYPAQERTYHTFKESIHLSCSVYSHGCIFD